MKKIIFIGQSGGGKTTLCQKLHQQAIRYQKTQAVQCYQTSIDTPGEYLENRHLNRALIVTAQDAGIIGLVSDPTNPYRAIPPGFGSIFGKKVIGIVTKIRLASPEQIQAARKELENAQAFPVFLVDTLKDEGITELFQYLESSRIPGRAGGAG